jgi:hypothetical protein
MTKVTTYWAQSDSPGTGQAAKAVAGVGARGFVQGIVTYTVMDNLTVTPMSAISSITLLNTLGVRDFGALQEKTVRLGSTAVSIRPTPLYPLQSLLNYFTSDSSECILACTAGLGDSEGVAQVQDRSHRRFPSLRIHLAPSSKLNLANQSSGLHGWPSLTQCWILYDARTIQVLVDF